MVYQVGTGTVIAGREIKVPQTFIPRVIRVVIIAAKPDGQTILNEIHVVVPETPVVAGDLTTVVDLVANWCVNEYRLLIHESIHIIHIHARSMEGLVVPQYTQATDIFGAMDGDAMPHNTSLPVEFTTDYTGPANHGAFYPFYPDEDANTVDGVPSTAYIADVQTRMRALQADLLAGGYPLVVASFTYSTFRPVTGVTVSTGWGTQDRRLTEPF